MNQNRPKIERYEELSKKVKALGWKLFTGEKEFINFRKKVLVECPKGHRIEILPYHLLTRGKSLKMFSKGSRGLGCPKCSGHQKTIDELKEFAISVGWKCLTHTYKTQRDPYLWLCPSGHEVEHTYHYFRKAQSCPECRKFVFSEIDFIKVAKMNKGKFLSRCKSYTAYSLVWFECNKGHEFRTNYDSAKRFWCPECSESQMKSLLKK